MPSQPSPPTGGQSRYPSYSTLLTRNELAAVQLAKVLAKPDTDPLWEHVAMLREDLQHVHNLLTGQGVEL